MRLEKYKPQLDQKLYKGFGLVYNDRDGTWYENVAVFADDFSTDTTGDYELNNVLEGSISFYNNAIKITNTSNNYSGFKRVFITEVGKKYKLITTAIGGTISSFNLLFRDEVADVDITSWVAYTGNTEEEFLAVSISSSVAFGTSNILDEYRIEDNIAIIQLNDDGSIDFSNATPVAGVGVVGKVTLDANGSPEKAEQVKREKYIEVLRSKEAYISDLGIYIVDNDYEHEYNVGANASAVLYNDGTVIGSNDYGDYEFNIHTGIASFNHRGIELTTSTLYGTHYYGSEEFFYPLSLYELYSVTGLVGASTTGIAYTASVYTTSTESVAFRLFGDRETDRGVLYYEAKGRLF